MDDLLGRELYRLSLYADLVSVVPNHDPLRVYRTDNFVRANGHLVQLWIYFTLRGDDAVELQHIEVVEEDMTAIVPMM